MNSGRWKRTKEILEEALLRTLEERPGFLDLACGPDSELRAEVESLIASHEEAGSQFLAAAAPEILKFTSTDHSPATASKTIGHYRLVEEVGRGGMGQVWLAEQTAPVKRRVALKLIRAGMYDDDVLKRFHWERQSLAIMDHPSIAKVFDAGATPQGQPYFVMEYVPGLPITDYCDQKHLQIGARLDLFIKVCEAVQHAHQKAIIHRDLKPANILVQEIDGRAVPRIIDFGLAKAITPQMAGETLFTQLGSFVGTPGYMSPEQCDRSGLDVDTRSDVYALGVVLYVLLTGCLPFQKKPGKEPPIEEMLRLVREEDPPSPSMKVSSDRETSSAVAEARCTEPKQLVSLLRGDLDWITLKALEKDRSRRYGTASELAGDLSRYLSHEPVTARAASLPYRLGKYVRRHRVGVVVAAAVVILLACFAVAQAVQVRRITRERDRANRITDFMTGMFKISDPLQRVGQTVTAREVLDKASKDVETGLAKDPELQARMMQEMGQAYLNLGLYPRAQSLFEQSVKIGSSAVGEKNPETLRTMQRLAWTLFQRGHLAEAEPLQWKVVELRRRVLGPENGETLASMGDLAAMLDEEGKYPEAEKMQREALEKLKRTLGPEHDYTLVSALNLAGILAHENRVVEAEQLQRQTLDIQLRVFGPEDLNSIHSLMNEAVLEGQLGKDDESEKLTRQALDLERRVLGPDQPETAVTVYNLACIVLKRGKTDEALSLLRQAVDHGLLPREAVKMGEDPDLKALHGDPRFAALIAHAKERAAAQKTN